MHCNGYQDVHNRSITSFLFPNKFFLQILTNVVWEPMHVQLMRSVRTKKDRISVSRLIYMKMKQLTNVLPVIILTQRNLFVMV